MIKLIKKEGWSIHSRLVKGKQTLLVETPHADKVGLLKLKHPALIYLDIYRKHNSPEVKFQSLKKAHDMFWPDEIWHDWTEDRFRTLCEPYNFITLASGASTAKSYDMAKLGVLDYFSNPFGRNITVASTTLASLKGRIWGYITNFVRDMKIEVSYKYTSAPTPCILPVNKALTLKKKKGQIVDDTLHGMFAVTAQVGDSYKTISTWIGKHPKEHLLLILDEATEMPIAILDAIPNLNTHPEKFKMIAVGNSSSTQNLHGLLSTPKNGWNSVSTELKAWPTTQKNGICLYFSPYESPAIKDPDPHRRKQLGKFLITEELLRQKQVEYGKESENYYRMVLGFWKSKSTDDVTATESFLKDFDPTSMPQWSGYYPIQRVAGLDTAISVGGDKPMLRIMDVGHDMDGLMKVDLNGKAGLFEIPLKALYDKSLELQLADGVIDLLIRYGVTIDKLGVDITGQGRGFAQIIQLRNQIRGYPLGQGTPLKVYSMSQHNLTKNKKSAPDIIPISVHELWQHLRSFIEVGCIKNMDPITEDQLKNRLIITGSNGKRMLETKSDYKKRMSAIGQGHSPDEADATAIGLQVVTRVLGITPGMARPIPKDTGVHMERMRLFAASKFMAAQKGTYIPKASNSGDLTSYIKYRKPF